MINLTENQIKALRYYTGDAAVFNGASTDSASAYCGIPSNEKAYCTINPLFYSDTVSERARVAEGKKLDPELITSKPFLRSLLIDLINAAIGGGEGMPNQTTYRVAREADVDEMKKHGKLMTFTSTSKNGFLSSYSDKNGLVLLEFHIPKDAPRADIEMLIPSYQKLEEAEVLLPPWLPAELRKCELSEEEKQITDRNGEPPKEKYTVTVGTDMCAPTLFCLAPSDSGVDAGKRFVHTLMRGENPDEGDEADYIMWKRALTASVAKECLSEKLSAALERSIGRVRYITMLDHNIEALFEKEKASEWIRNLLGIDETSGLYNRMEALSEIRITHTVSTFLLGSLIKDELRLFFNSLPRIFSSNNNVGDSFPFFWGITCLCHDIGYLFENEYCADVHKDERKKMLAPLARKAFLDLNRKEKDLYELDGSDLSDLGLDDAEREWALNSIELANGYNRYRVEEHGCIDHGIAGALILFDELRKMHTSADKRKQERKTTVDPSMVKTGFAEANKVRSRFVACGVLIALTIARHNMWVKKKDDADTSAYEKYNLGGLITDGEKNKVSLDEPLDQLLWFMDLMDTIDPLKGLYLRHMEGKKDEDICEYWKKVFLDHSYFAFCLGADSSAHTVCLAFDPPRDGKIRPDDTVDRLLNGSCSAGDWLVIEKPVRVDNSIYVFIPRMVQAKAEYNYGVTEEEMLDVCFYEGAPNGSRPGQFYMLPNAYQTLNLLMMSGLEGERVRIGREHQKPNSIYISEWERTVEVFKNVFSAQCKFMKNGEGITEALYRMDRRVNAEQMKALGHTIAYTSTTKAGFLPKFAEGKKEPIIEKLFVPGKPIPALDYEAVLGKNYAYKDEAEVLLPPFIGIEAAECAKLDIPDEELIPEDAIKLEITLGEMKLKKLADYNAEKAGCRETLNNLRDTAAQTLDAFVTDNTIAKKATDAEHKEYLAWKSAFQKLICLELSEIYFGLSS